MKIKILSMVCVISNFALSAEFVRTAEPHPPFCDQIPWSLLVSKNVAYSGQLIRLQGWLSVIEYNGEIEVRLFQDLESSRAMFVQNSVGLPLTDKTFKNYKNGDMREWLKLNGHPVLLAGYFKYNVEWLQGNRIGHFDEPVFLNHISVTGDVLLIQTIGTKWEEEKK